MKKLVTVLLLSLFSFMGLFSQEELPIKRPRIGVVLSGGGAKGLAHIGFLKVMEEAGIRPDVITGTSMGSIVGGLYAIGYSPSEIEKIATEARWDELLTNRLPLDRITIEEKGFYGRYFVELPIENWRPSLPKGVIEGQQLSILFSRLTLPMHDMADFSQFPVPFACVATDISTGEAVVLNKGSLPEAMRASMAIPSIFTPVEIEGRMLVDGGIVRNFPVQQALDMGADIIIGVYVSGDFTPKEELNSLVKVLSQSTFVLSTFDSREQKKLVNLLIEPNIEGFSAASFSSSSHIIKRGETATRTHWEELVSLADEQKKFPPLLPIPAPKTPDKITVDTIILRGSEHIPDKLILGKLGIKPGQTYSTDDIERRINFLFGTRYFDKVNYEVVTRQNRTALLLRMEEGPEGKLKLAMHFDTENDPSININLTYRNLIIPNSRVILETKLSKNPLAHLNYFKYVGNKQNTAISPIFFYEKGDIAVYNSSNVKTSLFDNQQINAGIRLMRTATTNRTYGLEVMWEQGLQKPIIAGEEDRFIEKLKSLGWYGRLFGTFNTMNHTYYPTKGLFLRGEFQQTISVKALAIFPYIDEEEKPQTIRDWKTVPEFWIFKEETAMAVPLSSKLSIRLNQQMALGSLSSEETRNIKDYFFIGGFNPIFTNSISFLGLKPNTYVTNNFFVARAQLQWEFRPNFYFQTNMEYLDTHYPMKWLYPDINILELEGKARTWGTGATVSYLSLLGPISLSVAYGPKKDKVLGYFNLGFWF